MKIPNRLSMASVFGACLMICASAFADGAPLVGPIDVFCRGSAGHVHMSLKDRALDFAILYNGRASQGHVAPREQGTYYSPGGEAYLTIDAPSGGSWLSIGASAAHRRWVPPHTACQLTRAPTPCQPIQVAGEFENSWDFWLDLMLDTDGRGAFTFNRIEFGSTVVKSLGADTQCVVRGDLPRGR